MVFPAPLAVTTPVSETSAIETSRDIQVTLVSVAFAGVTVAVRVAVMSMSSSRVVGLTDIPSTGIIRGVTVTRQLAFIPLAVAAVMVAFPALMAVTTPF